MNTSATLHRWTAAGLLATTLLLSVAPAAEAGNRWRRYKGVERSEHRTVSRVVVREHSGAGPVLAGLIGGALRRPRAGATTTRTATSTWTTSTSAASTAVTTAIRAWCA
jgi:hypothetical protein